MALISNVHYNLVAYAAGAFSVGQRCSNAGNAYQCVTGGTSSVAPTGTGNSITGGGGTVFKFLSAIDFTSVQAWANALPTTLTQSVVANLWNNGPITTAVGAPYLVLSGHNTTPSNNITIQPAPGEGFATTLQANPSIPLEFGSSSPWTVDFSADFGSGAGTNSTGVSFVLPAVGVGGINYFELQDNNVVFQGFQIQDPNSSSGSTMPNATQTCTITGCIFDGYSQPGGAVILQFALSGGSTSAVTFTNNLVIDRCPSGATGVATINSNYGGPYANSTFVAVNAPASLLGIINQSADGSVNNNITNCIFIGYTAGDVLIAFSGTMLVTTSAFSAGSLTGSNVTTGSGNVFSTTGSALFVDQAVNFRLNSTSPAINVGTTDTTDIPTSLDIINNTRVAGIWDIGAYGFINPTSKGTANGKGTAAATSGIGAFAIGKANGVGSAAGVSGQSTFSSTGKANGVGSASGKAFTPSVGRANGIGTAQSFNVQNAIAVKITLANPGTQVVDTPFPVSGTYTLTPDLQFADDGGTTFTVIPPAGVSALGTTSFAFTHPGMPDVGSQNLLVEDLVTVASASVNYPVVAVPPPPPSGLPLTAFAAQLPTSLQAIIPAYIYEEYADDDNIQAFATAFNTMAQVYLDWFNNINLPIYAGNDMIVGPLLDWVAEGLYGISRPTIAVTTIGDSIGPFNTWPPGDGIGFNDSIGTGTSQLFTVTDDIFKRIITWSFYKGDGFQFNTMWLKKRVMRFLAGVNGTDYQGPTTQVSVQFPGSGVINITLTTGDVPLTYAPLFQAAIASGVLPLPFQFTFNVLLN